MTRTEWFAGIIGVEPYPAPRCVDGKEAAYESVDYKVLMPPR